MMSSQRRRKDLDLLYQKLTHYRTIPSETIMIKFQIPRKMNLNLLNQIPTN